MSTEQDVRDKIKKIDERPPDCCGVCPPIVRGGYDCTCAGNPRCPNYEGDDE